MDAINNLALAFPNSSLYDIAPSLVLITTAESCPMCAGAIEWTGFAAVYYGWATGDALPGLQCTSLPLAIPHSALHPPTARYPEVMCGW
jgi:tRNA(Arg) A34 adenosine deaminase TadA